MLVIHPRNAVRAAANAFANYESSSCQITSVRPQNTQTPRPLVKLRPVRPGPHVLPLLTGPIATSGPVACEAQLQFPASSRLSVGLLSAYCQASLHHSEENYLKTDENDARGVCNRRNDNDVTRLEFRAKESQGPQLYSDALCGRRRPWYALLQSTSADPVLARTASNKAVSRKTSRLRKYVTTSIRTLELVLTTAEWLGG